MGKERERLIELSRNHEEDIAHSRLCYYGVHVFSAIRRLRLQLLEIRRHKQGLVVVPSPRSCESLKDASPCIAACRSCSARPGWPRELRRPAPIGRPRARPGSQTWPRGWVVLAQRFSSNRFGAVLGRCDVRLGKDNGGGRLPYHWYKYNLTDFNRNGNQ
jgi:hypothetical protein